MLFLESYSRYTFFVLNVQSFVKVGTNGVTFGRILYFTVLQSSFNSGILPVFETNYLKG